MSRRSGGAAASWSFGILVICFRAVFLFDCGGGGGGGKGRGGCCGAKAPGREGIR